MLPKLCAVSKTKPAMAVQELYDAGHRLFGNYSPISPSMLLGVTLSY